MHEICENFVSQEFPYMVNTPLNTHYDFMLCIISYMVVIYDIIVYSTGATVISKLLKNNHVIQELNMDYNNIGDDGISAIAMALTNSTVRKLWVDKCGITLTGARSIAALLSINHRIRTLQLTNNPITTEGIHVILQSALNNEASQVDIEVNYEYTDDEVQRKKVILATRRWMKTNEVVYVA